MLAQAEEYEKPLVEKYRPVTLDEVVGKFKFSKCFLIVLFRFRQHLRCRSIEVNRQIRKHAKSDPCWSTRNRKNFKCDVHGSTNAG